MFKIIDQPNGVIYNAKGDFLNNGANLIAEDFVGGGDEAEIRFHANGSISYVGGGGGGTVTTSINAWVETGAGWLGGSNYGIYWTYTNIGPNSVPGSDRSFANRLALTSTRTFRDFEDTGQGSASEITVHIYNETTTATATYNLNIVAGI